MGLLDFLNTPQGQALASGIASYAATARRGTPINNLGRGALGAVTGYQNAQDSIVKDEYNKQMMGYNMAQAETARMKAMLEQQKYLKELEDASAERAQGEALFKTFFENSGYDPRTLKPMKVSNTQPVSGTFMPKLATGEQDPGSLGFKPTAPMQSDMLKMPEDAQPNIAPRHPLEDIFDELGYSQARRKMVMPSILNNPEKGIAQLQKELMTADKERRGTATKINFDDALESIAAGIPVTGYSQYTPEDAKRIIQSRHERGVTRAKAGAPSNSMVFTPGAEAAVGTKGKEFGKFTVEATQTAQNSYDAAQDIGMIVQGMRGMGGGPIAEFKAWAGRYLPADTEWGKVASMSELASTIQAKMAPQMRVAGSGATSDFEMRMWLKAIPTLATTENGRELIAKYANRVAERAQVRAEVIDIIESQGRIPTPKEINAQMRMRLGDKFFDDADKAFFGIKDQNKPSQPASKGLSPAEQAELEQLRKRFGK